jgi:DNA-directed RNA polymerase specialized sigma24 family protein
MQLQFFDTQQEQWIDLEAQPSSATVMLHKLDGSIVPLSAPTAVQLAKHELKFSPPHNAPDPIHAKHREAVEETRRQYGLALPADKATAAAQLYAEGQTAAEIAERLGVKETTVRRLLRHVASKQMPLPEAA